MTRAPGVTTLATEEGERGMEITRTVEVYTLDELSEEARKKALDHLAEVWGEVLSTESVSEAVDNHLLYQATGEDGGTLSEVLGVWVYWDVYRGEAAIDGTLYRHKCPGLSWPDGVDWVSVSAENWGGYHVTDIGADDEGSEEPLSQEVQEAAVSMVRDLTRDLLRIATSEYEYGLSAEHLTEWYEINGDLRRFLADGSEAPPVFWSDDEAA